MYNPENSKSLLCSVRNEKGFRIRLIEPKVNDPFSGDIQSDYGYMHNKSKRKTDGN